MCEKTSFSLNESTLIGDKLNLNWLSISKEDWNLGMNIELEHGLRNPITNISNNNPLILGKIALAHVIEIPDYYRRLHEMEETGQKKWKNIDTKKYVLLRPSSIRKPNRILCIMMIIIIIFLLILLTQISIQFVCTNFPMLNCCL